MLIRRGYGPSKPKPVSYVIRKGYTKAHIDRYNAKTGKWKQNHKVESRQHKDLESGAINNSGNDGIIEEG